MANVVVTVPDEYSDIQQALDFPPPIPLGDRYIVRVREGTYGPIVVTQFPGNGGITIRGTSKPVIDGMGQDFAVFVLADDVLLQDLDITGAVEAAVGQSAGADRLEIRRCTLRGGARGFQSLTFGDVIPPATFGVKIWNTMIHSVDLFGVDVDGLSGEVVLAFLTVNMKSGLASTYFEDSRAIRVQSTTLTKLSLKNCVLVAEETDRDAVVVEIGTTLVGSAWDQDFNVIRAVGGAVSGRFSAGGGPPYTEAADLAAWKILSGRDASSIDSDPLFEDEGKDLLFLRQHSPAARAGLPLGLVPDFTRVDEDWSGVIRGVVSPSMGAHEVHDVIPLRGGARLLGILSGILGPITRAVLGTEGLEDVDNIFRPVVLPRTQADLGSVVKIGAEGSAQGSLVAGQAKFDVSIGMNPRDDPVKTLDRKIDHVSQLGLATKEGDLILARGVRAIPMDPLLPNTIEWGTRAAFLNAPASPEVGVWEKVAGVKDGPGIRERFGFVYDTDRDRVYLFGGRNLTTDLNDLWEWNPVTNAWTLLQATGAPSIRRLVKMSYDAERKRVYMYGGSGTAGLLDETWELDPATLIWTQLSPATVPVARFAHDMVYDPIRKVTVMYGRNGGMGELWEWDGVDWDQKILSPEPIARGSGMLAFNWESTQVALFGGRGALGEFFNDLWEYDGTAWTEIVADGTSGSPPRRTVAGFGYDLRRRLFVLFGGNTTAPAGGEIADTWERDHIGGSWLRAHLGGVPGVPEVRKGHDLVYLRERDYFLMYGGKRTGPDHVYGDTWKYQLP